ncbi:MAG: FtsX-like permease family protein, partial [Bacteroidota bacterium]
VDTPPLTHLTGNVWVSWQKRALDPSWTAANSYQYVKLKGEKPKAIIDAIIADQMEEVRASFGSDQTLEEFIASGTYTFIPQAITDIHLKSNLKFEPSPTGNAQTVNLFAGIALLILTLASINFINISTARATTRAKEVGVRKSMGTSRKELIAQFLLESVLVCII